MQVNINDITYTKEVSGPNRFYVDGRINYYGVNSKVEYVEHHVYSDIQYKGRKLTDYTYNEKSVINAINTQDYASIFDIYSGEGEGTPVIGYRVMKNQKKEFLDRMRVMFQAIIDWENDKIYYCKFCIKNIEITNDKYIVGNSCFHNPEHINSVIHRYNVSRYSAEVEDWDDLLNDLTSWKTDYNKEGFFTEFSHIPPYGLIPNELMRDDLGISRVY